MKVPIIIFEIIRNLAGVSAYLTNDWRRHLQVMNSVGAPALTLMLFFGESPRFLLQKTKYKEATRVLNNIARFNRIKDYKPFCEHEVRDMHASQLSQIVEKDENKKNQHLYTFLDLFANRKLVLYSITQVITGLTMNMVVAIMLYNIQDFSGNPFINISLMGLLRVWTPFVGIVLEKGYECFGRKRLLIGSLSIVFLLFLTMLVIDVLEMGSTARAIGTAAVLLGFIIQTGFVYVAYKLYTTELFPTVIRTIALSTFSCTSLLGTVIGPQLIYLKKYWHSAPYLGATISLFIALVLAALLLPETKTLAFKCSSSKLPIEPQLCNPSLCGVFIGRDSKGVDICGYPLNTGDSDMVERLKNTSLDSVDCKAERREGVHVFYIRQRKDAKFPVPVEVFIKCGSIKSLQQKVREQKNFMDRFEITHTLEQVLNSSKFTCKGRYGRVIFPLYAHEQCEFESMMVLVNNKVKKGLSYRHNDIISLKKYYNDIDEILHNSFRTSEEYSKLGCHNKMLKENPNSCLVYSETKHFYKDVSSVEITSTETLYRIHCCCKDSEKCFKKQAKVKNFAQLYCPQDVRKFTIHEDNGHYRIVQLEGEKYEQIIPVEHIQLSGVCYTSIYIERGFCAFPDFGCADLTVTNGDNCGKTTRAGSGCWQEVDLNPDILFPQKFKSLLSKSN
uniref:Uncharacterized protein n=1 Tax=Ditylenchus dipsaci TaxID=166011 RepID=A0A915DHB8_9BILA